MKGKLDRYSYLLAQAKVETGDYQSHWFSKEKNPWCVHAGSLFSRQKSAVPGDGGTMGVYGSFYAAWLDRLEWDEKRQVTETATCWDYAAAVVTQGRWFGENSTPQRAASYADAVAGVYHTVPGVSRAITWVASEDPNGIASPMTGLFFIGLIVFVLMLLFAWVASGSAKR